MDVNQQKQDHLNVRKKLTLFQKDLKENTKII